MNAEIIARLLMVLTGFVLAMLGVIVFIHGEHYTIGILISFFITLIFLFHTTQSVQIIPRDNCMVI